MENLITKWAANLEDSNDLYITGIQNNLPVISEEEDLSSDTNLSSEASDNLSSEENEISSTNEADANKGGIAGKEKGVEHTHRWHAEKPTYDDVMVLWRMGYGKKDPESEIGRIVPLFTYKEWKALSEPWKATCHKAALQVISTDDGDEVPLRDILRQGIKNIKGDNLTGTEISKSKDKKFFVSLTVVWKVSKGGKEEGEDAAEFLFASPRWKEVYTDEEEWVQDSKKERVHTKQDIQQTHKFDTKEEAVKFCKTKMTNLCSNLKKHGVNLTISDFKNMTEMGVVDPRTGRQENSVPSAFKKKGIDVINGFCYSQTEGLDKKTTQGGGETFAGGVIDTKFFEFIVYEAAEAVVTEDFITSIAKMMNARLNVMTPEEIENEKAWKADKE